MVLNKETHNKIFLFALLLLAAGLPLSIWLTSFAEIILVLNWLLEGSFPQKFKILKTRKSIWLIIGLYMLHLTGLLFTSDFSYAFHDLKIKLPILFLPLVIGTSELISFKNLRMILLTFVGATILGTFSSTAVFAGIIPLEYNDIREISLFISHIRFSLMIVFSLFILPYFIFNNRGGYEFSVPVKIVFILATIWLIFFLFILKTITGLFIFGIVLLIIGWHYSGKISDVAPRYIIRTILISSPLIFLFYLSRSADRFLYREELNFSQLETHTVNGNPYFHDTLSNEAENGNFVWVYINEDELRQGWNAISEYEYDGKDKRGQDMKYTLIRYMSSRGLRKDITGIGQLDQIDISAIEKGFTNHIFLDRFSLYPRIYEIMWEIDQYMKGYVPEGHSVTQRLLYLKAAFSIIVEYPIFGTGTGDVQKEFDRYYDEHYPELSEKWRRRAHNQYITFLLTFGSIGFVISMAFLFLPPSIEKVWSNYFFIVFFMIVLLSMLNEDTLETQTGVSFFMFFYSLLVFARKD